MERNDIFTVIFISKLFALLFVVAHGLMEYQDDVKSQDVRVPLFIKEEDDNVKKLLVKALSVPKGLAHITKPEVNITIIKNLGKGIVKLLP